MTPSRSRPIGEGWKTIAAHRHLFAYSWKGPPPVFSPLPTSTTPCRPSPARSVSADPPLFCQFHMDPPVPCPDCNPGIFICQRHLKECKARVAVIYCFCKRELCEKHAN